MNMKTFFLFCFTFFSLTVFSFSSQEEKKVLLIKTMYAKNDSICRYEYDPHKVKTGLAALYRQYCSMKFKKELLAEQRRIGLDHDFITTDWTMDKNSLTTMRIKKISDNVYHVSYVTNMEDPRGKMKVYNIVLCVKLTKEKSGYKIDDVIDLTNPDL